MEKKSESGPREVLERLKQSMNAHDLDALVACFDPDVHSEQPVHPDRTFDGSSRVRENWSQIFSGLPDIQATLLRSSIDGNTVWAEWE